MKIKNRLIFQNTSFILPLFSSRVQAGFPSPADDHLDLPLDLSNYLTENKAATFLVRATGDSMLGAGIFSGDLLVVDRSKKPKYGNVVIAAVSGELTVKRYQFKNNTVYLVSENKKYPPIVIRDEDEFIIWGVVTFVIHKP